VPPSVTATPVLPKAHGAGWATPLALGGATTDYTNIDAGGLPPAVPLASPSAYLKSMSPSNLIDMGHHDATPGGTAYGHGPLGAAAFAPPMTPYEAAANPRAGGCFVSHKYPAYNIGFPKGESTRQVAVRLEDVLMMAARTDGPMLIICPDTPARCILAYTCELAPEQTQYIRLPLHGVVEVGTKGEVNIATMPSDLLGVSARSATPQAIESPASNGTPAVVVTRDESILST
jgi:hypothetical protein